MFNIEQDFFCIDSNNLTDVKPCLYGYSIQSTGVYTNENLTEESIDGLDGRGTYIYVYKEGDRIFIRQDANGCYGLFIYQDGEYFALSNSFYRLVEYVSLNRSLTFNVDYANAMLMETMVSHSSSETLINEIEIVDRNVQIVIDTSSRQLIQEKFESDVWSISVDSEQGMKILDDWFEFWTSFFHNLAKKTNNIKCDLSGGYDSRISFLLLYSSQVDMNKLGIASNISAAEDYAVANKVANFCGIEKLNKELDDKEKLYHTFEDVIDFEWYTRMGRHKFPYWNAVYHLNAIYHIKGSGGEVTRSHYAYSSQETFVRYLLGRAKLLPKSIYEKLYLSTNNVINRSLQAAKKKYHIKDDPDTNIPDWLYIDARARNHFGCSFSKAYMSNNEITLAPLMDHNLWRLNRCVVDCKNNNLLMAIIYERYCPELLKIPFEGDRDFPSNDILDVANRINKKYPLKKSSIRYNPSFVIKEKCMRDKMGTLNADNQKNASSIIYNKFMKDVFISDKLRKEFEQIFDHHVYDYAKKSISDDLNNKSISHIYFILGMITVLYYTKASIDKPRTPFQILSEFV